MPSVAEKKKDAFPLSTWGGVQTMVTSYSMDYGKKDGTPSEKRPCSATRRNRPHPSKVFIYLVPRKRRRDGHFFLDTFSLTIFISARVKYFPCQGAVSQKALVVLAFGQGKYICSCVAAKENLTGAQTKGERKAALT